MSTIKFQWLVLKALRYLISTQGGYYNNTIIRELESGIEELDEEVNPKNTKE